MLAFCRGFLKNSVKNVDITKAVGEKRTMLRIYKTLNGSPKTSCSRTPNQELLTST